MTKFQDYFSAELTPNDIDLSGICYRTYVDEYENATYIFLGEKSPQPPIFDGDLMFFCDMNCRNCECDHCGGRIDE